MMMMIMIKLVRILNYLQNTMSADDLRLDALQQKII